MAIQPVFDYLNKQDSATRGFVARVMTVGMVVSIFLVILTEAYLAIIGKAIPPQISSLLFALITGQIVGIAHTQGANAATKTAPPDQTVGSADTVNVNK